MKLHTLLLTGALIIASTAFAQVGINNTSPDASAELDVTSTTRGFLAPRMTVAQMTAITSPAAGLAVYNTDSASYCIYNGSAWLKVQLTSASNWTASGTDIYSSNSGNVGIGTSTPVTKLHVKSGSFLISGSAGGTTDTAPEDGAGTRLLWWPEMRAFRAGTVNGTQWDAANIAMYSLAFGQNTRASGDYSFAFGNSATAAQTNSVAIGEGCSSSGNSTVCLGYYANSSHNGAPTRSGSFVFADRLNAGSGSNSSFNGYNNFGAQASNSFNVRAGGGLYFYTDQSLTESKALYFKSTGLGVGVASPGSTLEVAGAIGAKVKTGQVVGTNDPDGTGEFWFYSSGSGTITLPTASCTNRMYTIVNQSGAARTITTYKDLTGTSQTSLANNASISIVFDGTNWLQYK